MLADREILRASRSEIVYELRNTIYVRTNGVIRIFELRERPRVGNNLLVRPERPIRHLQAVRAAEQNTQTASLPQCKVALVNLTKKDVEKINQRLQSICSIKKKKVCHFQ